MQPWGFAPYTVFPARVNVPTHAAHLQSSHRPTHQPTHAQQTHAQQTHHRVMHSHPAPTQTLKNTGRKFSAARVHRHDTLRPFAFACKNAFVRLQNHIDSSIDHLTDEKDFVTVRGLDCKDMYEFVSSDGRPQKWALHTLMYGKMSESFTERENTHHLYGIISPFVALQLFYQSKGFVVTNESDPEKGHKLIIIVRRVRKDSERLWHGQNLMPEASDANMSVLTNFYQASIADAVRFVDTVFASRATVSAATAAADDEDDDIEVIDEHVEHVDDEVQGLSDKLNRTF